MRLDSLEPSEYNLVSLNRLDSAGCDGTDELNFFDESASAVTATRVEGVRVKGAPGISPGFAGVSTDRIVSRLAFQPFTLDEYAMLYLLTKYL